MWTKAESVLAYADVRKVALLVDFKSCRLCTDELFVRLTMALAVCARSLAMVTAVMYIALAVDDQGPRVPFVLTCIGL